MRDELLNETLIFTVSTARSILARRIDDYNTERSHSSLGYATPPASAAELEKASASSCSWMKDRVRRLNANL
jgi:putative transposase|tara:strand:+ start:20666 stop:20881 length:216 start_codon:yes stop_codon:yes gene_type:complete